MHTTKWEVQTLSFACWKTVQNGKWASFRLPTEWTILHIHDLCLKYSLLSWQPGPTDTHIHTHGERTTRVQTRLRFAGRDKVETWGSSKDNTELMTRLSDMMEKQPRLLSSKLFQRHRQVEVVLNRSVLAWKEIEKSRERSSDISCESETGKEEWMSWQQLLSHV